MTMQAWRTKAELRGQGTEAEPVGARMKEKPGKAKGLTDQCRFEGAMNHGGADRSTRQGGAVALEDRSEA